MSDISVGDKVKWDWGDGTGTGKVTERHTEDVSRSIKGTEVTRHGSQDNPAYYIKQEDGDAVLKLESELQAA